MNTAVLLLTMWLSNGVITARAIIAPSMTECEGNRQLIVQNMLDVPVVFNGKPVKIEYIDGSCHKVERGFRA